METRRMFGLCDHRLETSSMVDNFKSEEKNRS